MRIGVDFDKTLVRQDTAYEDVTTPLEWLPDAKDGLLSLAAAGHVLVLFSSRASKRLLTGENTYTLTLRDDFEPWYPEDDEYELHIIRYLQMLDFVHREVPGVFSAVTADKSGLDLFIDDKALRCGSGPTAMNWEEIGRAFGERVYLGATGGSA
jgi:hypothetical protein